MRRIASLLAVALAVVAGCGSEAETQPQVGAPAFGEGRFEDVPVMPGSEPFGPPHEEGGVVARSFLLPSSTPQEVMQFYDRSLDGWVAVEQPDELGVGTWRGVWARGDEQLTVSATEESADGNSAAGESLEVDVQYSLSLRHGDAS